ncbi:MAG: hypothetical protein U0528_02220 [Anaerolineae bacterium]
MSIIRIETSFDKQSGTGAIEIHCSDKDALYELADAVQPDYSFPAVDVVGQTVGFRMSNGLSFYYDLPFRALDFFIAHGWHIASIDYAYPSVDFQITNYFLIK